jgi:hypothetical protein
MGTHLGVLHVRRLGVHLAPDHSRGIFSPSHVEHTWQRLLNEAAAIMTPPDALVIDVTGLDFMACCAFAALAEAADRCRRRKDWSSDVKAGDWSSYG